MTISRCLLVVVLSQAMWAPCPLAAVELSPLLETIRRVESDGRGTPQAAAAWREVVTADPGQMTAVLAALDGAGPLAANWLRTAVDAIGEQALADRRALPLGDLEKFTRDSQHDPRARRLAFEWLRRADVDAAERMIPEMLNDPSVELRRDAVARLIDQANQSLEDARKEPAKTVLRKALDGARDEDQIKICVEKLRLLGEEIDLQKHFGFLTKWRVVGPFDNSEHRGFAEVFPPERELDDATYEGKSGQVSWVDYETDDDYGMVDLNQPLGSLKEVVGYAATEFYSQEARQVEFRLGCKNAWKLWVNGELLFGRDEYHRGMKLDQYRLKATLKPGANRVLMKVCQDEQVETWTVEWQFQLRVCDSAGTAIPSAE